MTEQKSLKEFLILKVVTILQTLALDGGIVGESASLKITQVKAIEHVCEVKVTFSRTETARPPKYHSLTSKSEVLPY